MLPADFIHLQLVECMSYTRLILHNRNRLIGWHCRRQLPTMFKLVMNESLINFTLIFEDENFLLVVYDTR